MPAYGTPLAMQQRWAVSAMAMAIAVTRELSILKLFA